MNTTTRKGRGPARAPRPPGARIDKGWVERAAADHLARYATPRAHLRRLLLNRIRNAVRKGREVEEGIELAIDEVLDRHVGLGTIDDAAWAETRARALTRRGVASQVVGQRLRQHGITDVAPALASVREAALSPDRGEGQQRDVPPDVVAGCAWARRKRAGPYAREGEPEPEGLSRDEQRARREAERSAGQKTLSAMARAGFSYDVCTRVLAMDRDAADELLRRLA